MAHVASPAPAILLGDRPRTRAPVATAPLAHRVERPRETGEQYVCKINSSTQRAEHRRAANASSRLAFGAGRDDRRQDERARASAVESSKMV
jgi:hypothetical protein